MLPISPADAQTLKDAVPLLLWAGKQIKAWLQARQANPPKSRAGAVRGQRAARDVAIVVRISRVNVEDVRVFLEQQQIDAEMIVISNSDTDEVVYLPNAADAWEELVREFYTAFSKIQAEFGARRFHIFLAAPAALAFAMGCTMSTLYDVQLYQWDLDEQTYVEVIRGTSRKRLMARARAVKSA
ncbi:MAG TPA: SAVED domain-containing protein [Anaerolineae bacterium]|nr:SAVED domain-containing protein [Anaerolineae bacterium]